MRITATEKVTISQAGLSVIGLCKAIEKYIDSQGSKYPGQEFSLEVTGGNAIITRRYEKEYDA